MGELDWEWWGWQDQLNLAAQNFFGETRQVTQPEFFEDMRGAGEWESEEFA